MPMLEAGSSPRPRRWPGSSSQLDKATAGHDVPESRTAEPTTIPGSDVKTPRAAKTRPVLKNRPVLLGQKVTVLEGAITGNGSQSPVKFMNRDGLTISASALKPGENDEVLLVAPVVINGDKLPGTLRVTEGVVSLSKDGQLKSEGSSEFESELPGSAVQESR